MLDGGLQRWKFREFPVYHGPPPTITPQEYNAKFDGRLVRTFEEMVENFNSKKEQVNGTFTSISSAYACGICTYTLILYMYICMEIYWPSPSSQISIGKLQATVGVWVIVGYRRAGRY